MIKKIKIYRRTKGGQFKKSWNIPYKKIEPVYVKRITKAFIVRRGKLRAKYTRELVKVLKRQGYTKKQIERAKEYSYVGKRIMIAKESVVITKYSKDRKKAYVRKKGWVKVSQLNRVLGAVKRWERVRAYKDLLGISIKEAARLLKRAKTDPKLEWELKKIGYGKKVKR
jgi:hypothetical protein